MALTGIINEHEFYSQHYLDEVFPQEIKSFVSDVEESVRLENEEIKADEAKGIKRDAKREPWAALRTVAREYWSEAERVKSIKSPQERIHQERLLARRLLEIFSLPVNENEKYSIPLENTFPLPILGEVAMANGAPYLWILQASDAGGTVDDKNLGNVSPDPLELCISGWQLDTLKGELSAQVRAFAAGSWRDVIANGVFNQAHAPRWVLLVHPEQWLLIDRAKFTQRRLLRFDWSEIFQRRETAVLQAATVLLDRRAFEFVENQCRFDFLDEGSFKHAQGVSDDLKYALREAIELLGNEAAKQLRDKYTREKKRFYSEETLAQNISDECLRYMYRMLFLFFVEARSELNYVKLTDESYLKGYSLESLRDFEMVPLISDEDRNGRFLHDSIQHLFNFFSKGTDRSRLIKAGMHQVNATANLLHIEPLQSTLFDESKMPLLKDVVFPNHVLQQVIALMSLSQEKKEKEKKAKIRRRGRISYAHLGLNQLGAVYESLLSYRGFFADDDLYEVKPSGKDVNPLAAAYFVKAGDLDRYTEKEKVFIQLPQSQEKQLKVYPKGSFIYRMAGRERENSASFYTPEVLTQCAVKEALDVLVKQQLDDLPDDKAKADKILSWRICEPAMGSAAFLNEAVNQVAELYMQHATKVPGAKSLSQEQYRQERQRVRMLLADRNIYGVDLNPVAVELAEVSLWLNALSEDRFVPWFGLQLECGNSLIGCRREAFYTRDLEGKSWKNAVPHRVGPEGLKEGEIWHFLVPDESMSRYANKVMKALFQTDQITKSEKLSGRVKDPISKIDQWRKSMMKPFSQEELRRMELISVQIDMLWNDWAQELNRIDEKTTDAYSIYGREEKDRKGLFYNEKQAIMSDLRSGAGGFDQSGTYIRLKSVMDYWCSLWFWPIEEADLLPENREEWLRQMSALINGLTTVNLGEKQEKSDLFEKPMFTEDEEAEQQITNAERRKRAFEKRYPSLRVVRQITEGMRFLHWELRFATVFMPQNGEHIGFDLTLGNPPWIVATWEPGAVLAEADPIFVIHKKDYSAKGISDVLLGKRDVRKEDGSTFFERNSSVWRDWLGDYVVKSGTQNFLNSEKYFPECVGSQSDLFKYFLPVVWKYSSDGGVQGLIHPETTYTETKGHELRKRAYERVKKHYQFANEKKLFMDVDHHVEFSVNVYGNRVEEPSFESINNLYHPITISRCLLPKNTPVEGRKDANKNWNLFGHPDRIIRVNREVLNKIADVFGTNREAPLLPQIHAIEVLSILTKFGKTSTRVQSIRLLESSMWHETEAKKDGTMKELPKNKTVFPDKPEEAIITGPAISVGTALYKCLDDPVENNLAATNIDLTVIPDDYLPRVRYLPALPMKEYEKLMPQVEVSPNKYLPFSYFYRLAWRAFVGVASERTLTAGIIPPRVAHPHTLESMVFKSVGMLLVTAACFSSVVLDFYVRQQGKGQLLPELMGNLPLPNLSASQHRALCARVVCLNCLTSWYADLWTEVFDEKWRDERWASEDEQINSKFFAQLTKQWSRDSAFRDDLSRRQALIEIDVIVAQAFGLSLDDLQLLYRIGFDVMRSYDEDTWYDQNGRIVFTPNSNGLHGVGLPRKAKKDDEASYAINGEVAKRGLGFGDVQDMREGTVSKTFIDKTLKGDPERTIVYQAPFFKKDRGADYAQAWRFFEKRHGLVKKH